MYNTMHAFHCFCFQRKTLYINCVHNRIFAKNGGGGQIHYWPPNLTGGAMAPPPPPIADPMIGVSRLFCPKNQIIWELKIAQYKMYTKILAQGTKFGSGTTGLDNPAVEETF